jgi:hypothetical protein
MAERKGQNYKTLQQAGEYGNACVAVLSALFAADPAATIVLMGQLAGGITITRVTVVHADLGSAQTMDIGYRYLDANDGGTDDPDGFFDGIDTGTAAGEAVKNGPIEIVDGCGIEILAQNLGDAATGQVDVIIDYVYNGQ